MLIVKRHPLGEKELLEVAPNRSVIEYLTDYDDHRDMEIDVFLNGGEKLTEKDYKRRLKEGDILTLAYRPSGIEVAIIAAVVAAVVLIALVPEPETPNVVGETSSSPNNSVSGQTNTVRKYEAIPNIYGRVWSYPDLIANAVPEWVNNRKQVRELFLIGEGEYQVDQIRDGTTDIDDIAESSATVYGPNTYPSDLLRIGFNDSVNDEELIAPDDTSLVWSGTADVNDKGDAGLQYGALYFTDDGISFDSSLKTITFDVGGLQLSGTTVVSDFSFSVGDFIRFFATTNNNFEFEISGVSVNSGEITLTVVESVVDETISGFFNFMIKRAFLVLKNTTTAHSELGLSNGSEVNISYVGSGSFTVNGISISEGDNETIIAFDIDDVFGVAQADDVSTTLQKVSSESANIIGPFTMPSTAEQIWFNLSARNGLQSSSGGQISVSIDLFAQEIDSSGNDVGSPVSQTVEITGKTTNEVGRTVKMTGLGGNRYKVYAERTTNRYSGSAIQDVFWQEVFTVNEYSGENFGNVTVMDVVTKASSSGTTSSRKINADVTRKLDGVATVNFADAVVDLIVNKGSRPISEIDTTGLYEIADSLTDDLKEFSFTFDDKNISLAQAVQTACNVARVNVYRDGQMWRFNRDEAKPRTYVFNRRNLASGNNQKFTQSVRLPNDYDSVALRYYNRDLESFDDVLVRIDSDAQSFVVGEDGERPYELELAGCSNYAQALNRANLEARKIVYLRRSVEDVALNDAANVDIGDRVAWCDIYDGETMDGEIVGQDGSTFYTSEEIVLEDGTTYYAMITDEDGQAMTPVEVAAVDGNKKAFTATLAGNVLIADNYLAQAGSKYIIGSVDDIDDTDYSVVARGSNENGRINIELIQYNETIYEAD
ncbi:MAG: hypothetical protein KTR16_02120 [Acidiferrobacterales bacterium]|nr:hypothetical protein [Acidiferrobacterales bacterium]